MQLILSFGAWCQYSEELFKCLFAHQEGCHCKHHLFIIGWCSENQGQFIFEHSAMELLHCTGWVEFHRRHRCRKKTCIVRSKSHITELFVTDCAGVLGWAVLIVWLAWESVAAVGVPWWKGVDWSSIHIGSHRKAYWVRNDFLNLVVPELYFWEGHLDDYLPLPNSPMNNTVQPSLISYAGWNIWQSPNQSSLQNGVNNKYCSSMDTMSLQYNPYHNLSWNFSSNKNLRQ